MGNQLLHLSQSSRTIPCIIVGVAASAVMLSAVRNGQAMALGDHILFGSHSIGATKILSTSLSGTTVVFKDLRPILPGHVFVVPTRSVAKLADLTRQEIVDLFETVRSIQKLLKGHFDATAFNLAITDGVAAGQPVPHVHVHVVPRKFKDLENNDLVYDMLDRWSPVEGETAHPPKLDLPDDDRRIARTEQVMGEEAAKYKGFAGSASGNLPSSPVQFGSHRLPPTQVFFTSKSGLSYASVNLKPLVPGHVLVIPHRVVQYLSDLTAEELEDLWLAVRQVQEIVLQCYGASASKLGLQDGKDAGQSVPHVHVHILPVASPQTSS